MSCMKEDLLAKIESCEIVCGVVGLGYVGLPLAVEKAKAGFKTIGFDVQSEKVDMVNEGRNYIGDVVDSDLDTLGSRRNPVGHHGLLVSLRKPISSPSAFLRLSTSISSPTLVTWRRPPQAVAAHLRKGSMVVLESTTYPGTTEELIKPLLEEGSGLVCGKDFYLGFSPERVDPGNLVYKTKNTPKVVGAIGEDATEVIAAMYEAVLEGGVTRVSSPAVAEMEKILENTYRNVNIGLVNELAMLCDRMGIDIWEVVDAAKTKPYGFTAFYPGPGLGGHCIPLDPYYLSWKAREYGFHTSMIESSMMINDRMPEYCVDRAARVLNESRKAMNGASVLVLGVAYKQDIDDYRESPALRVIEGLEARGAKVSYYRSLGRRRAGTTGQSYASIPDLTPEAVASADLVMVTAAHTNVDYDLVQRNAKAILDTKNAMKGIACRDNIEVL